MAHLFKFTYHALEQCASRYDREFTHDDAELLLETAIMEEIYKLKDRTYGGETQWHLPTVGLVMITKVRDNINLVVTVIDEGHVPSIAKQRVISQTIDEPREKEVPVNSKRILRLEVEVEWHQVPSNASAKQAENQLETLVAANLRSLVKGLNNHRYLRVENTKLYKLSDTDY